MQAMTETKQTGTIHLRDRSDRDELQRLRVCLARVAQAAGLDDEIPGKPAGDFGSLCRAADEHDRGWNRLCNFLVDAVVRK
jgi:hypothetical protein